MHSLKIDIWRQTEDIVFIIVCLHEQIRNKFFSFSVTRQAKRILHKGKSHSTADLQLVCFGFSWISTQREINSKFSCLAKSNPIKQVVSHSVKGTSSRYICSAQVFSTRLIQTFHYSYNTVQIDLQILGLYDG